MADYSINMRINDRVMPVTMTVHGGVQKLPNYEGSYTVTPTAQAQTLQTANKSMTQNVTVNATPIVTIEPVTITENGTTTAPSMHAYSPVTVAVPLPSIQTLTVTENGTTTAPSGVAYGTVNTAVPLGVKKCDIDANGNVTKLTTLDVSNIVNIGTDTLKEWQKLNTSLTGSLNFNSLITIGSNGLYYAFQYCTGITGISFPFLTTVDNFGLQCAFRQCTSITRISFPSLESVGNYALYDIFYGCTNLTEIHFKATAQSAIETTQSYSSKFGASNATIYFDL